MKRHFSAILVRVTWTALIAAALPVSHLLWGANPSVAGVEGPSAFAFLMIFAMISAAAAAAYLIAGSLIHALLRKRLAWVALVDSGLGLALLVLAIVAGVTANYV